MFPVWKDAIKLVTKKAHYQFMSHKLNCHEMTWPINLCKFIVFLTLSGGFMSLAESHFGQNDTLARDSLAGETVWPVTLWPEWHFGQSDTLARETLWPEWHFGQRHFGQSDILASFSSFLWGTKGWKKFHRGTKGKNLKKKSSLFKKKGQLFFSTFFLWSPPMI